MHYSVHKKARLLKNFDKTATLIRGYVVSRYGKDLADILFRKTRQNYERLIPQMPQVESFPALNAFLKIATLELAVFRALKEQGKRAPEAWELCHEALRARTEAMPKLFKKLIGWYLFTGLVKNRARKISGRDLGGFTIEYVEEEGAWGVNYRRCAIYDFLKEQNAEDFSPYACLSDMALSDAMGWGLKRTETLADGCDKCDFRFRKGAPTEISSRTPEVQATIEKIKSNVRLNA